MASLFGFDLGSLIPSASDVGGFLFGTPASPGVAGQSGSLLPIIQSGLYGAATLGRPEPQQDYGATQAAYDQKYAFEREQLAQALQIAQLQAGAGGAGASAALEAAKIAARTRIAELKEKMLADQLALKFQARRGEPELLTRAMEAQAGAARGAGQAGLEGFSRAAQVLQGYRA